FDDWGLWIEFTSQPLDRRGVIDGLAAHAELEPGDTSSRLLEVVEIKNARRLFAQVDMFGVPGDADDFNRLPVIQETFAARVFIAEEIARDRLIDDGGKRRCLSRTFRSGRGGCVLRRRGRTLVLRAEITTRQDGHLHRLEEPGPDGNGLATHVFVRYPRIAGNADDIVPGEVAQQRIIR